MSDSDPDSKHPDEDDTSGSDGDSDIKTLDIHTDPEQHSGVWRLYLIQTNRVRTLVEGDNFNNFVLGVIVLAGFLVGIQTDPRLDPDVKLVCEDEGVDAMFVTCKKEKYVGPSNFFALLDFVILGIFGLECILKGVAEGLRPLKFFYNKEWRWNNFDFWVVVVCLPWGDIIGGDTNTGSLRILRLARLMRLMKLIKKVPQLRMIVMGLLGGLKSIGYILMLLMLLFYIFAILGMQLFRDNDPYHFGDINTSLFTLFRASTLEDWTEIMYTNYFGCDIYPYTDYKGEHESADNVVHPKNLYCHAYDTEKTSAPVFAAIYFPVFVLSCGLVTLSLFVATVTMSMTESMESMKEEQEEADRQRRLAKAMKGNNMRQSSQSDMSSDSVSSNSGLSSDSVSSNSGLSSAAARDRDKMQAVLMNAWDGVDLTEMLSKQTEAKFQGHPLKMHYMKLANKATFIAEHQYFTNLVIAAIMVASVLVGVETETGPNDVLFVIDLIIFIIFVLEFLVKTVAEGLQPWAYFYDSWNCFDFLIIGGSVLDYTGMIANGGIVKVFRLARLLRVLKLLRSVPALQVIVSALMKGMNSILIIGVILMIFLYFFAVMANIAFPSDTFHFGRIGWSVLTLWRASTGEDWTDLMYINLYGCDKFGYDMKNDEPCDYYNPQLIKNCCPCANPNHPMNDPALGAPWFVESQVIFHGMEVNRNTTADITQYGSQCSAGLISVMYFVVFFVLGGLVLLTLFIGVVTTSMEEASAQQREEAEVKERVLQIQDAEGLDDATISMYETVFKMLDVDGGGTIEEDELKIGLATIGRNPSPKEIRDMMREVDEDDSGEIDLAEFVQFMLNLKEQKVRRATLKAAASAVIATNVMGKALNAASSSSKSTGDERVVKITTRDQIVVSTKEPSSGIVLSKMQPTEQVGLNVPAAGENYLVAPEAGESPRDGSDVKIHPVNSRKKLSNKVVPEG